MSQPPTVSLSAMVDLAVGTPEIGAVNFNVLHSLLHVVLDQLQLADLRAPLPCRAVHAAQSGRHDAARPYNGGRPRETSDVESDSGVVVGVASASELAAGGGGGVEVGVAAAAARPSGKPADTETPTRSPAALHRLEERVGRVERQPTDLNSLPSTKELSKVRTNR